MKQKLLLLLLIFPLAIHADEVEIDGIWYDVITKGKVAKVIQYKENKYAGDVVIPATVEYGGVTCQVTEIAAYAFRLCRDMTTITLPSSITSIGEGAFNSCNFITAVYISDLAAWCGVQFASSLSNPLNYAKNLYLNNEKITDLTIPVGVETIGDYAFFNAAFASVVIPNGVQTIGKNAFDGCTLKSVTISPSVTKICGSAFQHCQSLAAVHISNLKAWCNISFEDNPLALAGHLYLNDEEVRELVIPEGITSIGYTFPNCKELTSVTLPQSLTEIGNGTFENCTGLTSMVIPDNVTTIGRNAFYGCSNLATVTLSKGMKTIGSAAFQDCEEITSIVLPNGLTTINSSAFSGCTTLSTIVIPNSVTILGYHAFRHCNGLKTVVIGNGLKNGTIGYTTNLYFGDYVFADCGNLEHVYCYIEHSIPNSYKIFDNSYVQYATLHVVHPMLEAYKKVDSWSGFGSYVSLTPEELKLDADKCSKKIAFADEKVKSILVSNYDYDGDGELSEGEAEYVNDDAFVKCVFKANKEIVSFDELKYFTGLTLIEPQKFYDCSALTSVCIPEGVTVIGYEAFQGCTSLTSVTIPSTVETVGNDAFMYAMVLTTVKVYATTPPAVYEYSFYTRKNATLYVPRGCKPLYEAADYWKEFKEIVEMDESGHGTETIDCADDEELKRILIENWDTDGDGELSVEEAAAVTDLKGVFRNKSIKSLDVLKYFTGLKVIACNEFESCTQLETITFPPTIEEIETAPFSNCSALKSIVIPASVTKISNSCIGTQLWNLQSIKVETGNTVFDSRNDCNAIIETATGKLVYGCQNTIIPAGVTIIGSNSFNSCLTKPIEIPEGVITIEKDAFLIDRFNSITLPSTLKEMTSAFAYSWLIAVESHIAQPFPLDAETFNMAANAVLYVPAGTKTLYENTAGWNAFTNIFEIEEETAENVITFKDEAIRQLCVDNWDFNQSGALSLNEARGVLKLGTTFRSNTDISSFNELRFFTGLTSIDDYAFRESKLSEFILPPSVTSIGQRAFMRCRNLKSVYIPETVTSIANGAFNGCNGLELVIVNSRTPIAIESNTFSTRADVTLYVPLGTKELYLAADYWKDFKEIIEVGPVTTIDDENFPDENFRNYLQENYGEDGMLAGPELAVAELDLSGLGISDLTGIACFTALTELNISNNQISGASMDALIESLPTATVQAAHRRRSSASNALYVLDLTVATEANVITETQASVAIAKGWTPYYYDGTSWVAFAGGTPSGIQNIMSGINFTSPVYSLSGHRVTIPKKGIIITGGKKYVIK